MVFNGAQEQQAQHIVEICKRLHSRNFLAAADGNISVRLNNDEILITPSGIAKAFMDPAEISVITIGDQILKGTPSSERMMHLEVYKSCSQARAIVHAHPPTAIAWSIARPELKKLPSDCLSEVILAAGDIPFVPYARPGTKNMGDALKKFLPQHRAMILRNHGALTWGESLEEAYRGMERIEHSAIVLEKAFHLGWLKPLPQDEIRHLYQHRRKLGETLL